MKKLAIVTVVIAFAISLVTPTAGAVAPEIPTGIVVTEGVNGAYLNGTLGVKWSAVTNATAYSVRATPLTGGDPLFMPVTGGSNTETLFTGLTGGITYSIQVRSVNALLEPSEWSSAALTGTPKTVPNAPVKPTSAVGVGTATVSWTAVAESEDGGFDISGYLVKEINSSRTLTAAANATSIEFTGLSNGASVEFTVAALNAATATGSISPKSDVKVLPDVPGLPSAPTIETTTVSTEAKVSWTAPSQTNRSDIVSYTITLVKDGVDAVVKTITDMANLVYTFVDLTIGSFAARVSAANAVGSGPASSLSTLISITASPTAIAVPSSSASASASATATPLPSAPAGGGSFGGGGGFAPMPSVSESATASPKPSETPTVVATPTPSPTPIVVPTPSPSPTSVSSPSPVATISPSAAPSAITTKTSSFTAGSAVKGATKAVTITANNEKASTTLKTAISPILPTVKKGTAVTVTIKGSDGKSYVLASGKTTKTAAYKVPPVKFAKTGTYIMTIKVGSVTKKVTITVKK